MSSSQSLICKTTTLADNSSTTNPPLPSQRLSTQSTAESSDESPGSSLALQVNYFRTCPARALGHWSNEQTCIVGVQGQMQALSGSGEKVLQYLRNVIGVIIEVDVENQLVTIRHSENFIAAEAARVLHLQLLHDSRKNETIHVRNVFTPTPVIGTKTPIVALEQDVLRVKFIEATSPEALEKFRASLEFRRVKRNTLLEYLTDPRGILNQFIRFKRTVVRIRLPRTRTFGSEDHLYDVGLVRRAVASINSNGKPTWMIECEMAESKLYTVEIIYLSNGAISIIEVCRIMAYRRGVENTSEDVFREFFNTQ